MKKYIICDSEGNKVAMITTIKDNLNIKLVQNNEVLSIKEINTMRDKKSTEKQKAAVEFVESWIDVEFTGDIDNFYDVSDFLSEYLDEAKRLYDEVRDEYTSYVWSKYLE